MSDLVRDLRAKLAAASPGPWEFYEKHTPEGAGSIHAPRLGDEQDDTIATLILDREDADLIVALVNNAPELLDELERVTTERDEARAALGRVWTLADSLISGRDPETDTRIFDPWDVDEMLRVAIDRTGGAE